MKKKVLIIDTCLACVWMHIPGKEVAGPDNDRWDFERVNNKIQEEISIGTQLILPLASIIETGNHVSHVEQRTKQPYVEKFGAMIEDVIEQRSPWAFGTQSDLWSGEKLRQVVNKWEEMNLTGEHSLGDVSILAVATMYRRAGFDVEILTSDQLLKAYEDVNIDNPEFAIPRRRKRP